MNNSFYISSNSNETKRLNPGLYRITVSGLSDPGAVIVIKARNEADTDWNAPVQITAKDSGVIGANSVTLSSNGLVNCYATGLSDPSGVHVRLSP